MRKKLPAPTHDFVGRVAELDQVSGLLKSGPHRLITLIGPGGIGKTRLAEEAVRRARTGGIRVHSAPLGGVSAGAELAAVQYATAMAVIPADVSPRSEFDGLVATLGSREAGQRVVLVLDNCEHVATAALLLITALLDAVPDLMILATSRGPMGWRDERLINVPQLPAADALTLFRARAELVGHTLVDEEIAADICARIHHNPLFIQLVAARLRYQALASLRAGLTGRDDDNRLQWGISEPIAWSYNLCSDKEQLLFRRLSVFAPTGTNAEDAHNDAGASLAAIQAICSDDEASPEDSGPTTLASVEIAGLLEALVDHALITIYLTDTQSYSLHESLRVFAAERLRDQDPGEPTRLARRHVRYYRGQVLEAAKRWNSSAEVEVIDRVRRSWPNIVTALDASVDLPDQAIAGLQMCLKLIDLRIPFIRGSIRDIRRYTQRCLDASMQLDPQPIPLQTATMSAVTWMAVRQGDPDAERLLEQCIHRCLPEADPTEWRTHPDTDFGLPALLDLARGTYLFMRQRDPRAIAVLELAVGKFRVAGDPYEMFGAMFEALAAALLGPAPKAHSVARRAVGQAQASGAPWTISWVQLGWAVTLIKHGDPHEAARVLREALRTQLTVRDQWGAMWSVLLRAWALADMITGHENDRDRDRHLAIEIAHLVGGVATLQTHLGVRLATMGSFADETDTAVAAARAILGDGEYLAEHGRGADLSPHTGDVHRLALGTMSLRHARAHSVPARVWDTLTPTEKKVALLAAAGQSNGAIARQRGSSRRTVDTQLSSILSKLDVPSRHNIREHVPAELLNNPGSSTRHSTSPATPSESITPIRPRP